MQRTTMRRRRSRAARRGDARRLNRSTRNRNAKTQHCRLEIDLFIEPIGTGVCVCVRACVHACACYVCICTWACARITKARARTPACTRTRTHHGLPVTRHRPVGQRRVVLIAPRRSARVTRYSRQEASVAFALQARWPTRGDTKSVDSSQGKPLPEGAALDARTFDVWD